MKTFQYPILQETVKHITKDEQFRAALTYPIQGVKMPQPLDSAKTISLQSPGCFKRVVQHLAKTTPPVVGLQVPLDFQNVIMHVLQLV